jgi:glycosyltransferase involved in cell wall biosynthesis
MTYDFTIVTINYNNMEGLERTIASVEAQTLSSVQHVVVDGGSDDGSVSLLRSLEQRDGRSWSSEPDDGIYDAINTGMNRAEGNLVIVLNSGDCLAGPDTLADILDGFASSDANWAYGGIKLTDTTGFPVGIYRFIPFDRKRFVLGKAWIPHATVIIRQSVVSQVGMYRIDIGSGADQEFLIRLMSLVGTPYTFDSVLCTYEVGGTSFRVPPRQRELSWHLMRRDHGYLLFGSLFLDRAFAELKALYVSSRRWVGQRVKRLPGLNRVDRRR